MATGHDADRPALTLFAAELRAARQHAGLTRDELSAKVNYSSSLIGMIETGRRVPSRDLAERLDEVSGQDRGTFARLETGLRDLPYPASFRPFSAYEAGPGRCGCSSTSWFPACCRLPTTRGRSCLPVRTRAPMRSRNW
jgi:DNA-binding XRE family transcriptional regulator